MAERISAVSASPAIQTFSIDDRNVNFAAGDTSLGGPTNVFDLGFDSTPTRSGQTVTHVATIAAGSGNFTIRRIALHNDTVANVNGTSATLVAGVDNQSLTKLSGFALKITVDITYTSL